MADKVEIRRYRRLLEWDYSKGASLFITIAVNRSNAVRPSPLASRPQPSPPASLALPSPLLRPSPLTLPSLLARLSPQARPSPLDSLARTAPVARQSPLLQAVWATGAKQVKMAELRSASTANYGSRATTITFAFRAALLIQQSGI